MRIIRLLASIVILGFAFPAFAADINGIWLDPDGGIFAVKTGNGRVAWMGQGAKDGRFFLHKGAGTIEGDMIKAEWLDMPESEYYPSQGNVTGTVSAAGDSITWQDGKGYYRRWVRQLTAQEAAETEEAGSTHPETWNDVARGIQKEKAAENVPETWQDVNNALQGVQSGDTQGVATSAQDWADANQQMQSAGGQNLGAIFAAAGKPRGGISDEALAAALDNPLAWQQPHIQQLIDEWLGSAQPEHALKDSTARYEEWGRITGRGITMAGKPDINEPRHQYLWRNATKFPSLNLCTMRVYVERRIRERPLDDCRRPVTPPAPETEPMTDLSGEEISSDEAAASGAPDWRFADEQPPEPENDPVTDLAAEALMTPRTEPQAETDLDNLFAEPTQPAPAQSTGCAGRPDDVKVLANGQFLNQPPRLEGETVVAVFLGDGLEGMNSTDDDQWQEYFGRIEFVFFFPPDMADMEVQADMPKISVGLDAGNAVHQALFGHGAGFPHLAVFDRSGRMTGNLERFDPIADAASIKQLIEHAVRDCGALDYDPGIPDGRK